MLTTEFGHLKKAHKHTQNKQIKQNQPNKITKTQICLYLFFLAIQDKAGYYNVIV